MVTTRSVVEGVAIGAGMAAFGYFAGTSFDYLTSIGRVEYLNDVTSSAANICRVAGYLGGSVAGAYHAFWSPQATVQNQGPIPPRNPTNINIRTRGGRNNFRF